MRPVTRAGDICAKCEALLDIEQATVIKYRLDVGAKAPMQMTKGAAGFDLCAYFKSEREPHRCPSGALAPGERRLIPCGLYLEIPKGFEGQVRPRSGLALKHGITVLNAPGTIDSDYRGEVGALLINQGSATFYIENGDRIAQLVICPVPVVRLQSVEVLTETDRGEQGFGSTGVNAARELFKPLLGPLVPDPVQQAFWDDKGKAPQGVG